MYQLDRRAVLCVVFDDNNSGAKLIGHGVDDVIIVAVNIQRG